MHIVIVPAVKFDRLVADEVTEWPSRYAPETDESLAEKNQIANRYPIRLLRDLLLSFKAASSPPVVIANTTISGYITGSSLWRTRIG